MKISKSQIIKLIKLSILFLVTIVIIAIIINKKQNKEGFLIFENQLTAPLFRSSPSTRNMSLDLRCQPYIEKKETVFKSTNIFPLPKYKCLEMKDYLPPRFRRFR